MSYFEFENKKVYYNIIGEGQPLMLLHGNTASSKMFELILPLYTNDFKVIVIDFLGHGQSDRVDVFPDNMYEWEADQVISLLELLNLGKVSLVGTSGGAWVAINVALKREDFVYKVVADSFDGRKFADDFADKLLEERKNAKLEVNARQFYEWCQGSDWETIVDLDTKALLTLAKLEYLFCKFIEELNVPLLMIGSREDEMCRDDMEREYVQLSSIIKDARIIMYDIGKHPLILSRAMEVSKIVISYVEKEKL